MLRAVPKRAAHRKDVSLHRLRLDHAVGPYGFEQLIVRDQASCIFDQIRQNEKGLRAQENALLRPGVATSPETLVQGIEPEGNKHFHRRSGGQTSDSARDGVQCIALAVDPNARSLIATPAISAATNGNVALSPDGKLTTPEIFPQYAFEIPHCAGSFTDASMSADGCDASNL